MCILIFHHFYLLDHHFNGYLVLQNKQVVATFLKDSLVFMANSVSTQKI